MKTGFQLATASCLFWYSIMSGYAVSPRFDFVLHDGLVTADITHLSAALEDAYKPITSALELTGLPTITVQIWRDQTTYQNAMQTTLGSAAPGSRGYVTGNDELRLLYHQRPSAPKEAVHEFVHVASLHVNPDFGNNPRWLWEAVAQFLAKESVDQRTSNTFKNSSCPSLAMLNSPFDNGGSIYHSGYLLIDFINRHWSFKAVIELIKNNGDIETTLRLSAKEFEHQWCEFVLLRQS